MKTSTMHSVSKTSVLNDKDFSYSSQSTTPPDRAWFWHVYFHFPWGTPLAQTLAANIKFEITYYLIFKDPVLTPVD